jgi:hypothetical protein
MTERESRSGIPGQATRCEDAAREQGVDEAHARSRVRPVREPTACALGRPVAPRWQPPIHCGAPDRRISAASAYEAQLSSLAEGQLEDRVRGLGVLHTVPEQVGRVVAGRDRAVARREVDRGGESRVAVRLVLIRVVE